MLGLDQHLAHLAGGSLLMSLAVAVLLGLRHATDPDHLTAVTTIVLGDARHGARRASRLGMAWGLGHATTLVALGLPAVLLSRELPEPLQRTAEACVGVVIAVLAARLLVGGPRLSRARASPGRSPRAAYGIGLLHGAGGSAGVGVLLISAMPDVRAAIVALVLFAAAAAASMALASAAWGQALVSRPVRGRMAALTPAFATVSLVFGVWYAVATVA
jgi:hypothetical protein